ncbi:ABC transporter ATP-binding protein [Sporosarcina aquimarina]|uniref:ABC transporter ATP-binding protein n=1 Tax=Sporosarcina aquimarina TaxID=114975 RepID=A0ABU4FUW9_9BACL|nr:ABC transporter ATP-binding protein [Sporosarcina aquimarina]MDW0108494.1 ABC transporter ATP-binding protein [Sporosarcina aquimarina]
MTVISLNQVQKKYSRIPVLTNVTFSIKENVITGVAGRNGAGKTTLLKIIAGFMKATEGDVQVFDENPFGSLLVSANSIYIDDAMSYPNPMKLQELLHEFKRFYANWNEELAMRLMEYFAIPFDIRYQFLSKGKRSTFNAIVGIAARCSLTIFDEPTTGMDTAARNDFYRALLKDYIVNPRTILLSSHYIDEIQDIIEDLLVIHRKQVRYHGTVSDLQEAHLSLRGTKEHLTEGTLGKTIVSKTRRGLQEEWILENDFSDAERTKLSRLGIANTTLSLNDAYLALTEQPRGGIDDVFDTQKD